MKVKELIAALSEQDPEGEIYYSHSSHDYWGSMIASPVSDVEETEIQYSAYHQQYSVPKSEEFNEDDKSKVVVLLS